MALHIRVLDTTVHIDQDAQPSPLLKSPKAMVLLFCLLIPHQAHRREVLADRLWEVNTTAEALRNLRVLLYRLRKHVPHIKAEGDRLFFEAGPGDDIDLFTLTSALDSSDPHILDKALQVYRAHLLQGFYLPDTPRFNEWLAVEREALRRRVYHVYQKLCTLYQEKAAWRTGILAARRWLDLDPLDEDAHYWLMVFLVASGQRRKALAHYQSYCQMLREHFDWDPAPKMIALSAQVRDAQGAHDDDDQQARSSDGPPVFNPDWGEVPDAVAFWGREDELAQLETWITQDQCPFVIILGMGGQGKTALAAQLARSLANQFEGVIWRSLLNGPLPGEILRDLLNYFSQGQFSDPPASINAQLTLLGDYLKRYHVLVVLDNLESVLLDQTAGGQYGAEYEAYDRILRTFSGSDHQSTLLVTSRESPQGLERATFQMRSLKLAGLPITAGREMLQQFGVSGSADEMRNLVERYSGNPLALKLVMRTVQDFYGGSISAFLQDETAIFEDIRAVLDQQFERLTPLEQDILFWLAIERESVSLSDLQAMLLHPPRQRKLLEAVYGLQRRSLLEKHSQGFGLQNVIIEYLTDLLVERVSREIIQAEPDYLHRFGLQPARCRDYVRLSQARRILAPIAHMLVAELGLQGVEAQIKSLLERLRSQWRRSDGYAAGNLLHLLLHLSIDLTGYDFSSLSVRQVDLQGVDMQGVNFTGADLSGSVFTDRVSIIYAVAYSPNGQLLAAGDGDGSIHIWWTATGQPALTIQAHTGPVWGIALSPDSLTLASSGADGSVRLWDAYSGSPGKVLQGHPDGMPAVAFSPDGKLLAGAGQAGQVWIWDAQTGETLQRLTVHTANVQTLAFSPDGVWLATGARDHLVHLWEVRRLERAWEAGEQSLEVPDHVLHGHTDWVNALAFSPDSRSLASASADATISLWHVYKGEVISDAPARTLRGHTAGVYALAFSPDGRSLASGSNDRTVRLWNRRTGQIRHTFSGHTNWIRSLAFSPDGQTLASGSWDHSVRLWDTRRRHGLQTYHGIKKWGFGLALSPDGQNLASASADGKVRLWDVITGNVLQTLKGHSDWVWNVEFTPDASLLISASMDHTLCLWDSATGTLLATLCEHHDGLQSLAISPDGKTLASGGLDHTIILWGIAGVCQSRNRPTPFKPRVLHKIEGHTGWCLGLAFSPDGATLASSSADHTIRLWDVDRGECFRVLQGHRDGVQQVFFSPDGQQLASVSWDKTALLWDVVSGEILHRMEGHIGILRALAFSPDGKTLATGGNDQTVRLWDVCSGQLLKVIRAHSNWVFYLLFNPDGRTLVSASSDETIKLWDVRSGKLRQTWQIPGPYAGMNITAVTGLSTTQRANLKALGAVVNPEARNVVPRISRHRARLRQSTSNG